MLEFPEKKTLLAISHTDRCCQQRGLVEHHICITAAVQVKILETSLCRREVTDIYNKNCDKAFTDLKLI
jgi:hypothetical protein